MGYKTTDKLTTPGLGGWTYGGDVSLGDPPAGYFYVDQTSMSSGAPTIELSATDANGIDHSDWLQDLVNTNHLILRNRVFPSEALLLEISSNASGTGFRTIVGDIRSGNGTFAVGVVYDLWSITTSEDFVAGPASSVANDIALFDGTTGKLIKKIATSGFSLASESELRMDMTDPGFRMAERTTGPTGVAGKGHVWVRDDAPTALIFTNDIDEDLQLLGDPIPLGSWNFNIVTTGGTPGVGQFNANNTLLTATTTIRFTTTGTNEGWARGWLDELQSPGYIVLRKKGAPSEEVVYSYETITDSGGTWADFNTMVYVSDTTADTNWATDDEWALYIQPKKAVNVTVDGTTAQDAALLTERANHVNTPATGLGELWLRSDTNPTQVLVFTDENAADAAVMVFDRDDDGTGNQPSTNGIIPVWDSVTDKWGMPTDTFVLQSNELKHLGTDAVYTMEERSAAPTATSGRGKTWVRTNGANTAMPSPSPWFTGDTGTDHRLGMQCVTISGEVSPTTGSTWYSWGSAGPYNDTLWTDAVGTGAAPTTSNWFTRPPLILIPGDAYIERVVGWYQSESATVSTWEMELLAIAIEDADTVVGTVDTLVDGSVNIDFPTSNAKITLLSHTVNDRTIQPTDTSHMAGLYMAFQETTGTANNVDLRFNVTIYWTTLSIDGWVSDGFS